MFGYQTIFAADFNKDAAATYAANFPGTKVVCGQVADLLDAGRIPSMDILIGGPPCQPFSTGGEGLGNADKRDGIPDFVNVVWRKQPRMFLMENVPGMLRKRFKPYVDWVLGAFAASGYNVSMMTLDAVNFGVPQFRKRVWFWGIRNDLYAAGMRHQWPVATHAWPGVAGLQWGGLVVPGRGTVLAPAVYDVLAIRLRGRS